MDASLLPRGGSRRRAPGRPTALLLATVLLASLSGCSQTAPLLRRLPQAADDVLRQSDDLAQVRSGMDEILSGAARESTAVVDDAARARNVVELDPEGREALSTACGIATDTVSQFWQDSDSPVETTTAVEWFDYLRGVAETLEGAESLESDAQEVLEFLDAWQRGDVEEIRLQLTLLAFERVYCS